MVTTPDGKETGMTDANGAVRLFVDFDGTVAHADVGDLIFRTFLPREKVAAGWHADLIRRWKAGELSSPDCLTEECENSTVSQPELDALLDTVPLTAGFAETAAFCRARGVPLMILSDGLDYYIEFILSKYGLSDVPYRSNLIRFRGDGTLGVDFPYMDAGCGRCGNCKESHIKDSRRDGETVVYVGDGYSDRYAIRQADVIFARSDLAAFCAAEGVPFRPFDSFRPVLDFLEERYGAP